MVKLGRLPAAGRVTLAAIVREIARFVVRVRGRGKLCGMTRITLAADRSIALFMAADARRNCVSGRERKIRGMRKLRFLPRGNCDGVALGAVTRKPGRYVVRVFNGTIFVEMAALAGYRQASILSICMTGLAVKRRMDAHQGESCAVVPLDHPGGFIPAGWSVALFASAAKLPAVNVEVTVEAVFACLREYKRRMALDTPHLGMPSD